MTIWLAGYTRTDMIANQRIINEGGSMQALCLLSEAHLNIAIEGTGGDDETVPAPSLIVFDRDFLASGSYAPIGSIKKNPSLAGVPIFFSMDDRTEESDEDCYRKGAMVVISKQFTRPEVLRIENAAWQFENTRRFEKKLQAQTAELRNAKEIYRLNAQLTARNELLHKVFGRYFSDDIVNVILENPNSVSLGGEKRTATVMIADLRGFTAISEAMDPEVLTTVLNYYFDRMVECIISHHGTLIEFLGDGLLAVFGALLHNTTHQAEHAIRAAISMQEAMRDVNAYCQENGYPLLEMGIGLHIGEVFVGNIGSKRLMRYNVIGSSVNICSRIEGATVGGQILGSDDLIDAVDVPVEYSTIGRIAVKGASHKIGLCDITGIGGEHPAVIKRNPLHYHPLPVGTPDSIYVFPMKGKIISENYITAGIMEVSPAGLKLSVPDSSSSNLAQYEDVGLFVPDYTTKLNFSDIGWFAKITDIEDDTYTLHFTQLDEMAHNTLNKWVYELMGD